MPQQLNAAGHYELVGIWIIRGSSRGTGVADVQDGVVVERLVDVRLVGDGVVHLVASVIFVSNLVLIPLHNITLVKKCNHITQIIFHPLLFNFIMTVI